MKINVKNINDYTKEVELNVPWPTIEPDFESTIKKFSKKVKLPGFRPGKIPRDRLMQQFQPNIEAQFMDDNIHKYFNDNTLPFIARYKKEIIGYIIGVPLEHFKQESWSHFDFEKARLAWTNVAKSISKFEKVKMIVHPNELKKAKFYNKFIKALENVNKRVSK